MKNRHFLKDRKRYEKTGKDSYIIHTRGVEGSNPPLATKKPRKIKALRAFLFLWLAKRLAKVSKLY